nr:ZIP family metal transporter [Planomicrobium sp. CPCC 101079]
MFWLSFVFVIGFILIHLFSKNMTFLKDVPRSRFLSIAGGIAVAYVFLHLLPDLGRYQETLQEELETSSWRFLESHIYVIAMLGLALFYGLEKMAKSSKHKEAEEEGEKSPAGVFWVHIGSFTLYNAIIGYLLIREEYVREWGMVFFFVAMGVHFITNDRGLRATHKEDYDRYGRWLLTIAILVGWLIGVLTEVNELVISVLVAVLAGGVILNVLKEELPEERESSFTAFCLGLFGYSILLLLL